MAGRIDSKFLNLEGKMNTQTLSYTAVKKVEDTKKMEFSIERVAIWTLVFTNAYFIAILIRSVLTSRLF
jgi:hypothetical protein